MEPIGADVVTFEDNVSDARLQPLEQLVGVFAAQLLDFGPDRVRHIRLDGGLVSGIAP